MPGLTAEDAEWPSTIKEEVRPKRKAKKRGTLVDSGKRTRKRDRGAHRDPPRKQRRGERGTLSTNRTDTNRAADIPTLEMPKPMPVETVTDDNSAAEGRGGRAGGHEVTADGTEAE